MRHVFWVSQTHTSREAMYGETLGYLGKTLADSVEVNGGLVRLHKLYNTAVDTNLARRSVTEPRTTSSSCSRCSVQEIVNLFEGLLLFNAVRPMHVPGTVGISISCCIV